MGNEKNISGKVSCLCVCKEDKPEYNLPKRDDSLSLNYKDFLEKTKTGKPSFDTYLESLSRIMQVYDETNPYKKGSLDEIINKADAFLRRHANISYKDFLRQSKPEKFSEEDYGNLPERKNLRRRLFEHRTRLYLAALEDYEQRGYDVSELLPEIQQSTIPYLKKERDEPTFREIIKVLQGKV